MYNVPSFTLARTMGGILAWWWRSVKGWQETPLIVLASVSFFGLWFGEMGANEGNRGLSSARGFSVSSTSSCRALGFRILLEVSFSSIRHIHNYFRGSIGIGIPGEEQFAKRDEHIFRSYISGGERGCTASFGHSILAAINKSLSLPTYSTWSLICLHSSPEST